LPGSLEPTVDFLSLCLRATALAQSISAGILANRTDLAMLAAFGDQARIPLLEGWRRQAVGTELLAALDGNVLARIDTSTRKVHLEWQRGPGEISEIPVPQVQDTGSQETTAPDDTFHREEVGPEINSRGTGNH